MTTAAGTSLERDFKPVYNYLQLIWHWTHNVERKYHKAIAISQIWQNVTITLTNFIHMKKKEESQQNYQIPNHMGMPSCWIGDLVIQQNYATYCRLSLMFLSPWFKFNRISSLFSYPHSKKVIPRRGSPTIWVVVVIWYSETAELCSHLGEKYR